MLSLTIVGHESWPVYQLLGVGIIYFEFAAMFIFKKSYGCFIRICHIFVTATQNYYLAATSMRALMHIH